jgi:hypothetical protein
MVQAVAIVGYPETAGFIIFDPVSPTGIHWSWQWLLLK